MTILASDTFTEGSDVRLNTHTMNVDPGGGWTEDQGQFTVNHTTGRVSLSSNAGDSFDCATFDAGQADVTLTADLWMGFSGGGVNGGIVFNFQDSNNYWMFVARPGVGGAFIYEKHSGSVDQRGSTYSYSFTVSGTIYNLGVTLSGDTITPSIEGVNQTPYTTSGRSKKTLTRHGISLWTSGSDQAIDNLLVTVPSSFIPAPYYYTLLAGH